MKRVLIIIFVLISVSAYSQVETTPVYDEVYGFLKRMQVHKSGEKVNK